MPKNQNSTPNKSMPPVPSLRGTMGMQSGVPQAPYNRYPRAMGKATIPETFVDESISGTPGPVSTPMRVPFGGSSMTKRQGSLAGDDAGE